MKNRWISVPIVYAVLTAVYFPVAIAINRVEDKPATDGWSGLAYAIDDVFFWANTVLIYIFSVMGSSLAGTLWSWYRSHKNYFKGFGIMLILSVLGFLLLIIFACMQ